MARVAAYLNLRHLRVVGWGSCGAVRLSLRRLRAVSENSQKPVACLCRLRVVSCHLHRRLSRLRAVGRSPFPCLCRNLAVGRMTWAYLCHPRVVGKPKQKFPGAILYAYLDG